MTFPTLNLFLLRAFLESFRNPSFQLIQFLHTSPIQSDQKSCCFKLQNLPMTGHCYTSDHHSTARLLTQATTISYPAGCNSQLTYSACFRSCVPQPLPSLYSTDLLKIQVFITSTPKECIYSTYLLVIFSYASQPSPPSSSALLKQD